MLVHLSACPVCQTLVEALVDPALLEPREDERRRIDTRVIGSTAAATGRGRVLMFQSRSRWAAATALTAAAATLLIVVAPGTSMDPADRPTVAPRSMSSGATRPLFSILRAERLATSEMGLASVSWRGDASGRRPESPFDAARDAFDRGDFGQAEARLRVITARTPSFADAWLLLGVSRLLRGEAAGAIAPLERARAELVGLARQDAVWHLAVALHVVGRDDAAREALEPLCLDRTGRAAMACAALDELRMP